ncbi:rap guanine nucleotide exchange factor 1, partial [Anomaloglossus baeobatrachus]|uniref:rap guanine nucleotide exchange factor 1 n=1 Tax=Anomaloglossus baeobatrachus TaxID=238106 RepID=UPI003F506695
PPLSLPGHALSLRSPPPHQYQSVFRSYSQDFAPHSPAPALPLLSPAIFYSSRFSPVPPDAVPPPPAPLCPPALPSSQGGSSCGTPPACLPCEPPFSSSLQTSASENASDESGDGEYVNLYSSGQSNGDPLPCDGESPLPGEGNQRPSSQPCAPGSETPESMERPQNSTEGLEEEEQEAEESEEADELSLVDHSEIMARLTLKQEGDDGPDVRGGSGDILLVHATETDRKDLVLYCEAFLTTYRTFISPEELIQKLQYRYERFCHFQDTFKQRVSKNTFFVLVRVVDELCLVELTDDILKLLMELVFRLVCKGELSLARVLRKNILEKVDNKRMQHHSNSAIRPLASRGVAARPGTLHDFHSHEIAEQLTLLDAELFYKIEIPEVLLWAKEQNEEKSPNLTQFTEHFNNMSYWVRSIIMLQEKAQDRERLLLKFIKIMKHLRKLNNFNSYLAILSALDSAPIRRLEWQKQTSEGLAEYCTLIDSSSSFRAYRAALSEVEPPCIPYLGLILQDLTFVHLGNPDHIDGKVNFSKRWQQFNILDSMRRFQQVHYEVRRNDDIISFFNDFSDHLAEEALWELSLKIKPRNITRRKTERDEKT